MVDYLEMMGYDVDHAADGMDVFISRL